MAFNLPRYSELDKDEQDPVVHAPLDESILVTGPPGTGKSVLALYRAHHCKEEDRKFLFLVYNNTLNDYLRQAIKHLSIEAESKTWHGWFRALYNDEVGEYPPRDGNHPFKYDWDAVSSALDGSISGTVDDIVLDEGQDMPPGFYRMLIEAASSVSVFADENQSITGYGSTVEEIEDILGGCQRFQLRTNYRNTRQIAELAAAFYAGDESDLPDLPAMRTGPKPRCRQETRTAQMRFVRTFCANNSRRSIGILCNKAKEVQEVYEELRGDKQLQRRVEHYVAKTNTDDRTPLKFQPHSITVTTRHSAKGLEYDSVLIPFMSSSGYSDQWNDTSRILMYVAVSRARDEVVFLTEDDPNDIGLLQPIGADLVAFK
ncbi:MAG: DUF2075 domain-containing protein [Lentisphaerae bacterium]|nr:DUF2075 domain-containing protein [Lentisphaerota bacterium]